MNQGSDNDSTGKKRSRLRLSRKSPEETESSQKAGEGGAGPSAESGEDKKSSAPDESTGKVRPAPSPARKEEKNEQKPETASNEKPPDTTGGDKDKGLSSGAGAKADFDPGDPFADIPLRGKSAASDAPAEKTPAEGGSGSASPKPQPTPRPGNAPDESAGTGKEANPSRKRASPGNAAPAQEEVTRKLEETLGGLPKDEMAAKRHCPWRSIGVIVLIFLVLALAGAGVWFLLAPGTETAGAGGTAETAANDSADAQDSTDGDSTTGGPIGRTRDTVRQVESARAEGPLRDGRTPGSGSAPENREAEDPGQADDPDAATGDAADDQRQAGAPPEAAGRQALPAPPSSNTTAEDLRDEVTEFLRSIHIGAIRTGGQARARLDGRNYEVGDTVDPGTDLTFEGTRDGNLVFEDRNGVIYLKSF